MNNKRVLVTGADGFIGSHLVESLVRSGYSTRAFVLYNSFNSWGWLDQCGADVAGQFEVFAGDIRDPNGVRDAVRGCDVVLHLAALIAIPYSYNSPDAYVDTNIKGTLNVLQAARAVIPTIITQIASGKRNIKLGALTPTRDFNYVADTVSGFIAAMQSNDGLGEVVNLGSNFEISVGDTVKLIADVMRADIEVESDGVRLRPVNSEVERLWADNRKAADILGWSPDYAGHAGLRRGLQETVAWFADSGNLANYKVGSYNL